MKNLVLTAALLFACQMGFSQTGPQSDPSKAPTDQIYDVRGLEQKPDFPGGVPAFYKFIGKTFNVPDAKEFKGGMVFLTFIVEKDGSLSDVKVLRDCGFGSGDEAKRVLALSPKWNPGMQNGQPVRALYSVPIKLMSSN